VFQPWLDDFWYRPVFADQEETETRMQMHNEMTVMIGEFGGIVSPRLKGHLNLNNKVDEHQSSIGKKSIHA
jgi:hypothetical protein